MCANPLAALSFTRDSVAEARGQHTLSERKTDRTRIYRTFPNAGRRIGYE